jgi:hypothetical protein
LTLELNPGVNAKHNGRTNKQHRLDGHTFRRSELVKPLDKSLFNRSWINSITVFGSMKAVDDMSATKQCKI